MKAVTTLVALCALCLPATAQVSGNSSNPDSVKVRYIWSHLDGDDFTSNHSKHIILVNEEVTTHIVMPENIKLVDISTDKLVGNQCADARGYLYGQAGGQPVCRQYRPYQAVRTYA